MDTKYYFAYGSNMSTTQMSERCPNSKFVGVAALDGWEFFINERGFANVQECPKFTNPAATVTATTSNGSAIAQFALDPSRPVVYGMLYRLDPADERRLDACEGAPFVYGKAMICMRYFSASQIQRPFPTKHRQFCDPAHHGFIPNVQIAQVLVYVDYNNVGLHRPRQEYIGRMRRAVCEAAARGVPIDWMKSSIGRYVDVREELKKIELATAG